MEKKKRVSSVPERARDVNSKEIFKNHRLCSQFLRDNVDIPQLKQVQPEDIEDVSERYQAYFGVEFETDTVKKIRLKDESGKPVAVPLYMISLIEHKSGVDHDIMMQLLRYMVCIWHEYAKEMEREKKGISRRKDFQYPPILPIVYYEGSGRWTASRYLRDRIQLSDVFGRYVPDFWYEVVRIHNYSNEELLDRRNEMSLIMLLNKLQSPEEFHEFRKAPPEKLADALRNADSHILELIEDVMYSLMMKMNIPVDEANEYVKAIGGNQMGYLFENMEKIDIQEERRKVAEERKRGEEARKQTEEARKQTEEARKQAEEAKRRTEEEKNRADKAEKQLAAAENIRQESEYKVYIASCKEFRCTKEDTVRRFICKFGKRLSEEEVEAEKIVNRYWDEV